MDARLTETAVRIGMAMLLLAAVLSGCVVSRNTRTVSGGAPGGSYSVSGEGCPLNWKLDGVEGSEDSWGTETYELWTPDVVDEPDVPDLDSPETTDVAGEACAETFEDAEGDADVLFDTVEELSETVDALPEDAADGAEDLPAEDLVPEDVPPDTENACVPATFQWDFDDPCDADGWSTDGGWLPGPCQNHTPDGSCSLLLGDPDACLADAGGGKTISPLLDLTGVSSVQVEFSIFWGGAEPLWWLDTLDLTIDQVLAPDAEPLGTPVTIWAKPCSATMDAECLEEPVSAPCDLLGCEEGALDAWQTYQVTFDLSAYEWVPVPQRLAVLTFTAEGENPYLPMVDDILVTTLCE